MRKIKRKRKRRKIAGTDFFTPPYESPAARA